MSWVKTYESFVFENANDKEVEKLEKILKLPKGSGIMINVEYNKTDKVLVIEQPSDIGSMDAGALLTSINLEKTAIKRAYSGVKTIAIGDLSITI